MSEKLTEEKADFLAGALATLSRQIRQYCEIHPEIVRALHGEARQRARSRYLRMAPQLADQVDTLLAMAREVPSLRARLNLEQMEAAVERTREAIRTLALESPAVN